MARLEKIMVLEGKIKIITGLHIGAGSESVEIGGIDTPVVRDPRTGYPYIPGSSMKGKMRSLLEIKRGKVGLKGGVCDCEDGECEICRFFGSMSNANAGITRSIFRDCFLTEGSINMLHEKNLLPTEAKSENTIDRLRGKAAHPRTIERAIAGLEFKLEIGIRVFEGDGDFSISLIREGLSLVESDALGGNGSRGYGRVQFEELDIDGSPFPLKN